MELIAGTELTLDNITVYPRFSTIKSNIVKTGTFYVWDENIRNNRIRITNTLDGVGKLGFITGWIKIGDIIDKDSINVGDCVLVNGDINTYADGSGNIIHKENSIMYVVEILDIEQFPYNYAVATAPNRTKQGWVNTSMIEKYDN